MAKDHHLAYIAPEIYQDTQSLLSLMKNSIYNPNDRNLAFELVSSLPEKYLIVSDENGMNLLHLAVQLHDTEMVNLLIEKASVLTYQLNNNEETPLDYALFMQEYVITEQLQNIIIALNLYNLNNNIVYSIVTTPVPIPTAINTYEDNEYCSSISSNHEEQNSISTNEYKNDNNSLLLFPFDNENQENISYISSDDSQEIADKNIEFIEISHKLNTTHYNISNVYNSSFSNHSAYGYFLNFAGKNNIENNTIETKGDSIAADPQQTQDILEGYNFIIENNTSEEENSLDDNFININENNNIENSLDSYESITSQTSSPIAIPTRSAELNNSDCNFFVGSIIDDFQHLNKFI